MLRELAKRYPGVELPFIDGPFELVYEPNADDPPTWYVNDHALFAAPDGKVHFFGIQNPFPKVDDAIESLASHRGEMSTWPQAVTYMKKLLYKPATHRYCGHAVADHPMGPWTRHDPVLVAETAAGEMSIGAPFVVEHGGRFWMMLDSRELLAHSRDLYHWQRAETPIDRNRLGKNWRDPCIQKLPDGTYLMVFCSSHESGRSGVGVASSRDLVTWEPHGHCLVTEDYCPWSANESPFLVPRGGLFYLFYTFAHRHYYETRVLVSNDWRHFDPEAVITTLYAHAAEILTFEGQDYISCCGMEDPQYLNRHGLYLARLNWLAP